MKLAQRRPEYYDVEEFGIPVNDLDCIATIATFSATLIWLSFPRQGIWLRDQEIKDYIALFRYIAYLTGTPDEYFETPSRAKAVMETLLRDEIDPSATSQILANNILNCLEGQPPTFASRSFLEANCRVCSHWMSCIGFLVSGTAACTLVSRAMTRASLLSTRVQHVE
ncbi:MAG: hypothetical protein LQ346_004347 [Caloplaca aetnensis]|nr:MAG: hypothetical protein LQ346_004347 [Caloplaca aetnensis]